MQIIMYQKNKIEKTTISNSVEDRKKKFSFFHYLRLSNVCVYVCVFTLKVLLKFEYRNVYLWIKNNKRMDYTC